MATTKLIQSISSVEPIMVSEKYVFFPLEASSAEEAIESKQSSTYLMVTAYNKRPDYRAVWMVSGNEDDLKEYSKHKLHDDAPGDKIIIGAYEIAALEKIWRGGPFSEKEVYE